MGYYAEGHLHLVFKDQAAIDAALAEIAKPENRDLWSWNAGKPPESMLDAFCAVWATDMVSGSSTAENPLEFNGWVDEKWHDTHYSFAALVAPFATTLDASFRGEDGAAWAWNLKNGQLFEESLEDIPHSLRSRYEAADTLVTRLAEALTTPNCSDRDLLGVLKISLLDSPYVSAELVDVLARDTDTVIADAAARYLQAALSGEVSDRG